MPVRQVLLPIIVPIATLWVARQERRILREGVPLSPAQLDDAHRLGVAEPERVRTLTLDLVPLPGGGLVKAFGRLTGDRWDCTAGLTARYGIYLRAEYAHLRRLLAHELVHTRQYEQLGGIRPFLRQYLHECLTVGYVSAPMEQEASEGADRLA